MVQGEKSITTYEVRRCQGTINQNAFCPTVILSGAYIVIRCVLSSVTFFPSILPSRVCNQKQKTCLGNGLEYNLLIANLEIQKIRSLDKIRIFSLPRQKNMA